MTSDKHQIEAPPVVMPRPTFNRIACGMAAALGLAAGVLIGLAIGGVRSESRQWIDAERDRLAQEADSLARWKNDLDAISRDWEPFRAKRDQLTQELASARRERDGAVEQEAKLRQEMVRSIPRPEDPKKSSAAEDFARGQEEARPVVTVMALGSTLTLLDLSGAMQVAAKSKEPTLTVLWVAMNAQLDEDAENLRKDEELSRSLVKGCLAALARRAERGEQWERDSLTRMRDHFDKRVFGSPRLTKEK